MYKTIITKNKTVPIATKIVPVVTKPLTPLHALVSEPGKEAEIKIFLKNWRTKSANVRTAEKFGGSILEAGHTTDTTPLLLSLKYGHLNYAELLLQHGANVNTKNVLEVTAIHAAFSSNSSDPDFPFKALQLLLQYKPNLNAKRQGGLNFLHCMIAHCKDEIIQKHEDFIDQLLQRTDFNIDQPDDEGYTALQTAISNNQISLVSLLVKNKAKLTGNPTTPTTWEIAIVRDRLLCFVAIFSARAQELPDERTLLRQIILNDSQYILDYYLQKKSISVDFIIDEENQFTLLHLAAQAGANLCLQYLLSNNADFNKGDVHCNTPLHIAANNGYTQCVKLLLEKNPIISDNDEGLSPLQLAEQTAELSNDYKNYDACIRLLIPQPVDIFTAAKYGDRTKVIARTDDPNVDITAPDSNGMPALHHAIQREHNDCIEPLVEFSEKYDFDKFILYLKQAAAYALSLQKSETAKLIFSKLKIIGKATQVQLKRAAVTLDTFQLSYLLTLCNSAPKTPEGNSLLHSILLAKGSFQNRTACIKAVLASGKQDINEKNNAEQTPLNYFVRQSYENDNEDFSFELLEFLLEQGADPTIPDAKKTSPLDIISAGENLTVTKKFLSYVPSNTALHQYVIENKPQELAEHLRKDISLLNIANKDQCTPLLTATILGHFECVKILLAEKGIHPNVMNRLKRNVLLLAAHCGHRNIVDYLLKNNLVKNLNCTDIFNNTAAHLAIAGGNLEILRTLIANGIDLKNPNKNAQTPLQLAEYYFSEENCTVPKEQQPDFLALLKNEKKSVTPVKNNIPEKSSKPVASEKKEKPKDATKKSTSKKSHKNHPTTSIIKAKSSPNKQNTTVENNSSDRVNTPTNSPQITNNSSDAITAKNPTQLTIPSSPQPNEDKTDDIGFTVVRRKKRQTVTIPPQTVTRLEKPAGAKSPPHSSNSTTEIMQKLHDANTDKQQPSIPLPAKEPSTGFTEQDFPSLPSFGHNPVMKKYKPKTNPQPLPTAEEKPKANNFIVLDGSQHNLSKEKFPKEVIELAEFFATQNCRTIIKGGGFMTTAIKAKNLPCNERIRDYDLVIFGENPEFYLLENFPAKRCGQPPFHSYELMINGIKIDILCKPYEQKTKSFEQTLEETNITTLSNMDAISYEFLTNKMYGHQEDIDNFSQQIIGIRSCALPALTTESQQNIRLVRSLVKYRFQLCPNTDNFLKNLHITLGDTISPIKLFHQLLKLFEDVGNIEKTLMLLEKYNLLGKLALNLQNISLFNNYIQRNFQRDYAVLLPGNNTKPCINKNLDISLKFNITAKDLETINKHNDIYLLCFLLLTGTQITSANLQQTTTTVDLNLPKITSQSQKIILVKS